MPFSADSEDKLRKMYDHFDSTQQLTMHASVCGGASSYLSMVNEMADLHPKYTLSSNLHLPN